jgi:outer membrane immunogenic protein
VAAAWSWTGFYVGGHLGYAWQKNSAAGAYDDSGTLYPFDHGSKPSGFAGGGQIGYNWQNGNFVWGLEADISVLSGKGTSTTSLASGNDVVTTHNRIQWVGTLRGRVGMEVSPRTMVYGTGGLAYGAVEHNHTESEFVIGNTANWVSTKTKTGYAAGGGIEHAIRNDVTVRLEGLYVDLGKTTYAAPSSGSCTYTCQPLTLTNTATTVRAGINVRF